MDQLVFIFIAFFFLQIHQLSSYLRYTFPICFMGCLHHRFYNPTLLRSSLFPKSIAQIDQAGWLLQLQIGLQLAPTINILSQMGCATSNPEARKYLKAPTLCGQLKVTVVNCHLDRNTNSVMTMDPYVKLIMSNQIQKTPVVKKGGFDPRFDHSCSFYVNSCYKPYGRSLEIFVMDKNMVAADKVIGYGLLDLDPIIKKGQQIHEIKVRLNFECGEVGVLNLKFQFVQHPFQTISFRFEKLDVTKRTNIVGTMNCWVRLTVGEEVMETQKAKDTPECPPIWSDEIFMIEVPKCIPNVVIEAYDEKKLIGKGEYPVSTFYELAEQKLFKEIIKGEDKSGSGIIEFSVIRGQNAQFAAHKRASKKIQHEEKSKKDDDHKDEDKKEQNHKEEVKKEQISNKIIEKQQQKQKDQDRKAQNHKIPEQKQQDNNQSINKQQIKVQVAKQASPRPQQIKQQPKQIEEAQPVKQ